MKIADKIFVLVLFLILALAANTFIALQQVSRSGAQLLEVTEKDIVLTDVCNTVTRNYLENAIRFQSLLNIGDELAFAQMPASRREYLISHIQQIKESFDRFTQDTGNVIIKGKNLIRQKMENPTNVTDRQELVHAADLLAKIESSYIAYDQLFAEMFKMISAGNYELSIEDMQHVHQREKAISEKITNFLEQTRESTHQTLASAGREEEVARRTLFFVLISIILISVLTSIVIIRSFSRSLKRLVVAAHELGDGNLNVQVDTARKDEIGEVGLAFNTMTRQLREIKSQLEKQNEVLAKNLETTENQRKDLEKVNKELDQFAHTVSHDIAQPLTGIVAYSAILEENYAANLDQRAQRSISGIHKSAKRLSAMINDLLTLSRISRLKNPYEKVSISQVFDEATARLEYAIVHSQANINITTELPVIVCDRIKMTEIFYNLLNNAIKFSSQNKKNVPQVEVGYREQKDTHQFYVKDNGIGIASQHHEEIFAIFRRLENANEFEGTGAGLSLVKAGVEDHGGKIWVESKPGEGATFYFSIPKGLKPNLLAT